MGVVGWVLLGSLGFVGIIAYTELTSWPPKPAINQAIISGIQQQNPSVNLAQLQAWLANAPATYQAQIAPQAPSVTGYMQWVAVNCPTWCGGNPVPTNTLYNAQAATASGWV